MPAAGGAQPGQAAELTGSNSDPEGERSPRYPGEPPARTLRMRAAQRQYLWPPPQLLEILARSTPLVRQARNRNVAPTKKARICRKIVAAKPGKHHRHFVSGRDSARVGLQERAQKIHRNAAAPPRSWIHVPLAQAISVRSAAFSAHGGTAQEIVVNFTSARFSTGHTALRRARESPPLISITICIKTIFSALVWFYRSGGRHPFRINFMATVAKISQPTRWF
jgi:hypothetical protein